MNCTVWEFVKSNKNIGIKWIVDDITLTTEEILHNIELYNKYDYTVKSWTCNQWTGVIILNTKED